MIGTSWRKEGRLGKVGGRAHIYSERILSLGGGVIVKVWCTYVPFGDLAVF